MFIAVNLLEHKMWLRLVTIHDSLPHSDEIMSV